MPDIPGQKACRDFMFYVISTRRMVDMVEGAADFSVHVFGRMRETYEGDQLAEFDSGSIGLMARDASEEIENGFPLLHGHTLVGLWGALEACIEDVAVSWLSNSPSDAVARYLASVKVPLGEFLARDGDDRWRWVLLQIENAKGSALRKGVGQFEGVLDQIGLGGAVGDEVRDVVFFAKALRNLYAHQAGRADAKFIADCPAFDVTVGTRVPITRAQLTAAYTAMVMYVETVYARVQVALGKEPDDVKLPPWIASLSELRATMLPVASAQPE